MQNVARFAAILAIAFAAASGAHAGIVVFSTPFTSGNSAAGTTFWDIDGTGANEASFVNTGSNKSLVPVSGSFGYVANGPSLPLFGLPDGFEFEVSGGFEFQTGSVDLTLSGALGNVSGFTSGTPGIMIFQFTPDSTVLYGWANVTITTGDTYGTFTVNEWAYEDTGASIITGATTSAVPEPATYAVLFGALALGAASLRRRRESRPAAF